MYDIVLKHDKNGRCIETYNSRYDIRVQNTYDSKGRIVSKTEDNINKIKRHKSSTQRKNKNINIKINNIKEVKWILLILMIKNL